MAVKFIFLVSPRTHFLDLAGPDQVLSEAVFYHAPFELQYCSIAPENAGTASGLRFSGLLHFSEIHVGQGDYILIPGMDLDLLGPANRLALVQVYHWLSVAYAAGAQICSVCTGAFLLGEAGLLDGKICTTHWKYTRRLQERFPKTRVQENVLFTERDGIFTSAGIASGIDLALYLVEREMGAHFAHKVAREIVVYIRRTGEQAQQSMFLNFRNHIHAGIHAVQDRLTEHLEKRNSLQELADIAHMSTRNFTRIFKKETGIAVGDYITMIRKERLAELLKNADLSRAQIARQLGLKSERQVQRLLRQIQ
jgi:transcriptional regulator GlxA family with amidase domain